MLASMKELGLTGLEMADSNADCHKGRIIYLDFDGENGVSYDNDALNIHIGGIDVADSGLDQGRIAEVTRQVRETYAGTGVEFTTEKPADAKNFSTIYIGGNGKEFSKYGSFLGLSETIGSVNGKKSAKAFVFSGKLSTASSIAKTITHEAGHLLGFRHESGDEKFLSAFALTDGEEITLQIVNYLSSATDYYSVNYSDEEIWLYAFNTNGTLSYNSVTNGEGYVVPDATSFQLSDVIDGTLTIVNGTGSSKLFAGLGTDSTSPFSGTNGPGIFDNIAYSEIEWTVTGSNDIVDITYEDTFAFPATLRVLDETGAQTIKNSFLNNTTAESLMDALESAITISGPVGPSGEYYPQEGEIGWGPLVSTLSSDSTEQRWIGSSKYWQSGMLADTINATYEYAPSFNDYLKHLHDKETTLFSTGKYAGTDASAISGWYVDYSGNNGYSFYVSVTETDGNYGLLIHDIRLNTSTAIPPDDVPTAPWNADPTAWTALEGSITIAYNNQVVEYTYKPPSEPAYDYSVQANWTDITIYSGASLLDSDFTSGPIVIGTGDFATGGTYSHLNSAFLASLSASISTGLLGNSYYMEYIQGDDPYGTMYWFNTLERDGYSDVLFDAGWSDSQVFYDPYWATMAEYTNMQGYLSPFNDRWLNLSPDLDIDDNYTIVWELGTLTLTKMAPEDFIGDGKSDILFTDGTDMGYYGDGDASRWKALGSYSSGWSISGSGDYNGDGTSDILFSNGTSLGYYGGGEPSNWVALGDISSGWEISGCGDFAGDGKDDVLLTNGNRIGYYKDGESSEWVDFGSFTAGWEVAGCADFDGSDKDDVLFTNGSELGYYADGEPAGWTPLASYASGWEIAGVGDFDGSGNDDILFTNGSEFGYYAGGEASGWVELGSYASGWEIKGCADYDGNGTDDILLANGNQIGYYGDGLTSNWVDLGSSASGWQIALA